MRVLRTYVRIARTSHCCDICCNKIQAGEMYQGSVMADDKCLWVFKKHIDPCCDYPPEPDEDEMDIDESHDTELEIAA